MELQYFEFTSGVYMFIHTLKHTTAPEKQAIEKRTTFVSYKKRNVSCKKLAVPFKKRIVPCAKRIFS